MNIGHELLGASAGTGKTYQLTNRYLRLFFLTEQPERIIALTFTRKAAAEFFSKIFQRLADAADSDAGAARLGAELGLPLDRARARRQLRTLLDALHQLQLSTYDSFFSRIVQTFPFEFGLAGPPTVLDEAQQVVAIQRAQDALSRRTNLDDTFLTEFWFACRRATMGAETKTIADIVADFVKKNHALYFEAPQPAQWGDPATIWGGDCPWQCPRVDLAAEARALQAALPWATLKPRQAEFWREYVAELESWNPPAEMPRRIDAFTTKFLEVFDTLESGACVVSIQSKMTLSREVGAIVRRITRYAFWTLLQPRLEATRGVYDLVRLFESVYGSEVRQAGRITLADATRLLGPGTPGAGLADPALREQLAFRLDGWFDHWLLDEFQDTSHGQWAAIADLVDEVMQDGEGRRSFFAVGDTKQSIYRWRGSDDRLFGRIARRYEAVLERRTMAESYRSAPAVLAMVNRVFGDPGVLEGVVGPAVAARWSSIWEEHRSAPPRQAVTGEACLVHAPTEDEQGFGTVRALLNALRPLERGLSVAILTRENATAEALVDEIRAQGGPACSLAANVRAGRDSVVAAGLRSLLSLAAHPGDRLAWVHLGLSPMGRDLEQRFGDAARLSGFLLAIWGERGLTGLVDEWTSWCTPHLDVTDTFNARRLEACRSLAVELDQGSESDIDAFVEALDRLELREHDVPGQVAVMTIHKAKGLDWDVVIVTDLAGNTLSERPKGQFEVQRDEDGAVEWICDLPPSELAAADRVLGARLQASREDAAFERLCALYVGLTRAKRGLYVVTHPMKGSSPNYHRLLDTALEAQPAPAEIGDGAFTIAWRTGHPNWHEAVTAGPVAPPAEAAVALLPPAQRVAGRAPQPVQPSAGPAERSRHLTIENPGEGGGAAFGSLVHEALARVEWLDSTEEENGAQLTAAVDGQPAEVAHTVHRVLAHPAARRLFTRADRWTEVWREMPFECIQGDAWVSGRFDRVRIERDAAGRVRRAELVDFKTSGRSAKMDPQAYAPQIERYRQVLAQLCDLPLAKVEARVVMIGPETVAVGDQLEA